MTRDLISRRWTVDGEPLPSSMAEWELLLAQARSTRLSARLAVQLASATTVPVRVAPHLRSALQVATALHTNVCHEVQHLARTLAPLQTPVVLLKGAAYVAAGLPPAAGRLFSDIDILVARDRLRDVEDALFAAGWLPEKLKPYDERYYRQWMHELPPMQHVQRHGHLDVHHTIAPPTSRFKIDGAALLKAALPLPLAGVDQSPLRVLAPADMVLHSALHMMQDGEFASSGLRDLLDINDLLTHFSREPSFWPGLIARANELQLGEPLGLVLVQLDRLFGTRPPLPCRDAAAAMYPPHAWSAALMRRLLAQALQPQGPGRGSFPVRLCRWLLYVRSHWLRMPWYQIAPHLVRKAWARSAERFDWMPKAGAD